MMRAALAAVAVTVVGLALAVAGLRNLDAPDGVVILLACGLAGVLAHDMWTQLRVARSTAEHQSIDGSLAGLILASLSLLLVSERVVFALLVASSTIVALSASLSRNGTRAVVAGAIAGLVLAVDFVA